MCIVIDINTFTPVFSEFCEKHQEFSHVKEWIDCGQGTLVFGGTKYKNEISQNWRHLKLIRQLKEAGKAVAIDDTMVDEKENEIKRRTEDTDCDDQHIIALLGVSNCPLLCSEDARSFEFVKDRSLFPNKMPRVRIYSSARNRPLLKPINRNILKNVI